VPFIGKYILSQFFFLQDSHSSDHFATCEEVSALLRFMLVHGSVDALIHQLARKLISEGEAYMDDTDQETMQAGPL